MRILLAIDFDIEARLLEGMHASGHDVIDRLVGAESLIESVTRNRPDIVIAQGGPETLTTRSLTACDAAGSRIIVLMADELERRNALALGVVDRLDAHVEWDEIERLLQAQLDTSGSADDRRLPAEDPPPVESRRARRNREQPRPGKKINLGGSRKEARPGAGHTSDTGEVLVPQPGRVLSVWGPAGAPGRTSLAIGLAASFANRGMRAVLIDADPYGGAVAPLLGIDDEAPGLAAACRLAGADTLSSGEFDRVSSRVKTGSGSVRVLAGISNPERWPELGRVRIKGVIEQARREADVVVIDVGFNLERDEEIVSDMSGPRRNAATHTALELSDSVIALAEATPLGIQRYLRARLHLLECVGAQCRIDAVANKVRGSVTGVDAAAQVRQALRRFGGIEHVTLLPNDHKACDRAIANARAIVDAAPRSQLSRQIVALAERLVTAWEQSASQSLVGLTGVEHHQPHSAI